MIFCRQFQISGANDSKECIREPTKREPIGKDLSDKPIKFEEDDPLLRAMKNELSCRIFGSPASNSFKKEDLEDPYMFRNSSSPLPNGDKYSAFGLMPNNYNLLREYDLDNQWFSILPKESCDPKTLLLGKIFYLNILN